MRRGFGLPCSLEHGITFRTGWKFLGLSADLFSPRRQPVLKRCCLLETPPLRHGASPCFELVAGAQLACSSLIDAPRPADCRNNQGSGGPTPPHMLWVQPRCGKCQVGWPYFLQRRFTRLRAFDDRSRTTALFANATYVPAIVSSCERPPGSGFLCGAFEVRRKLQIFGLTSQLGSSHNLKAGAKK